MLLSKVVKSHLQLMNQTVKFLADLSLRYFHVVAAKCTI